MMKGCAVIVLLFLVVPLGQAARVFGFKPLYWDSDSQVKADPASSYPLVENRTPEKAILSQKERLSNREKPEKYSGSEDNLKANASAKSKASHQLSNELLHAVHPFVKADAVEPEKEKTVVPFHPLGHSPGIGHDNPPGLRH